MRAPLRLRTALPLLLAGVALATATGCTRELRAVDLETMTFEDSVPPIDASVEVCIRSNLHKRQWSVEGPPYRIALGKRAALHFERMAKQAFREAVAVYTDACGATSETPWVEATIVSANRDYDGIEGFPLFGYFVELFSGADPVDTALTMSFALHADDGSEIWSTEVKSEHRVVDTPPPPIPTVGARVRARRGSRDFAVVLRDALDRGYQALISSETVRRAFDDDGLERAREAASAGALGVAGRR
ncbi:MAG: hypothetical protein AAGC67_10285 [Myxococcota bacterium]